MTETLETHDTPTIPAVRRASPLFRALAWVGIAAGSLFIVATVFFSGYVIGQHSGGGGHHGRHAMLIPRPPMGPDGPEGPRLERLTPPSAPSQQPSAPARP